MSSSNRAGLLCLEDFRLRRKCCRVVRCSRRELLTAVLRGGRANEDGQARVVELATELVSNLEMGKGAGGGADVLCHGRRMVA